MRLRSSVSCLLFLCFAHVSLGASGGEAADPGAAVPRIVAHRGLLRHAPENTLANYAACLALGLGFETDLQRTRDGHLVCIHDTTVDRTTNGHGRVNDLTLAELRKLDAGSWFDPAFAGQKVPTLAEVFELVRRHRRPGILVAIDFKGDDPRIERDLVRTAKQYGVLENIFSIGRAITEPEVRRRLRDADPKAQVARLAPEPAALPEVIAGPDADWVYLRFIPTREQVEQVHRAGKRVFIAGPTVVAAQPENWKAARERGVDGLLTDEPLEVRQLWRSAAPPVR